MIMDRTLSPILLLLQAPSLQYSPNDAQCTMCYEEVDNSVLDFIPCVIVFEWLT